MAVVLVGILIVPLGNALAGSLKQASDLRQRAGEDLRAGATAETAGWEWGPKVVDAWWRPGPVLHVRVSGEAGSTAAQGEVGLWVDGWSVGTQPFAPGESGSGEQPSSDDLQVGPQLWTDLADERVGAAGTSGRRGHGVRPWRLAVPGLSADAPTLGSAESIVGETPLLVVHRPGAGTSSLMVSWSPGALSAPPFSLLFLLKTPLHGWSGATLDGRSQWWRMEEGRSVDVYY